MWENGLYAALALSMIPKWFFLLEMLRPMSASSPRHCKSFDSLTNLIICSPAADVEHFKALYIQFTKALSLPGYSALHQEFASNNFDNKWDSFKNLVSTLLTWRSTPIFCR